MRLLICAGATGGGIYPALSVFQALDDQVTDILWVGAEGRIETDLVTRENIPFTTISAAGLHGVGLRTLPGNLFKLAKGFFQARRIIKDFKPDVFIFTGGFMAVPVALAGMNIPTLAYVPDLEPALAMQVVTRFADIVAVSMDEAHQYYPAGKRVVSTGYPVRKDFDTASIEAGLAHFNLTDEKPILLVFGGSLGAQSINNALHGILPQLLADTQVIHVTGKLNWEQAEDTLKNLPPELKTNYRPMAYLHEMGLALASANLVVSRAGAGSLGEFPYFGLPAVLVPYPHAWRYQQNNAEYLADKGGAVIVQDAKLAQNLLPSIQGVLQNTEKRRVMAAAMKSLAVENAAQNIADLAAELAAKRRKD